MTAMTSRLAALEGTIAALPGDLAAQVARLKAQVENAIYTRADYVIPAWYDWNFWEPSVQLGLRDLCQPGDIVLDVGANAGALSILMSRLVGPRGSVFAFEASRRIVDKTQFNIAQNGCTNVQVLHRAVYRESGALLSLFEGSHFNDSLYHSNGVGDGSKVLSVFLDDFVRHWGIRPSLVKMDIEGAEFDALLGAKALIQETKPHFILEQEDTRCWLLLREQVYLAVDLASYALIEWEADFPPALSNILFVHKSRQHETPYGEALATNDLGRREATDLSCIPLQPGRYVIETLISADRQDNEIMAGIEADGQPLVRYHTNTKFLADSYRFMPFHLDRPANVGVFFQFQAGTHDPTFRIEGASIRRVPALSELKLGVSGA
jgi:FkbM family methyltransferase